ncbi:hypothetical protein [Clostridium tunisiense]|uniref:hypothetical protein n=1 Tax=Clostridium tunisiense TaxID=219748 RepID=UPI0002DD625F|nr:hypothetical protein [Clostridium tunisiense]
MNNNKISISDRLKVLGCIAFDIALILAFFKVFGLFIIIAPVKSILMLFTLIIGLLAINIVVILPSSLYKKIGIPYTISFMTSFVLYAISANVLSIFLIGSSVVWYIIWELIIFAAFIGIISVFTVFSGREIDESNKVQNEQCGKASIMMELLEIEDILKRIHMDDKFPPIFCSFKALKERIQVSTPFGRIIDNNAVKVIESQIKGNLIAFKIGLQEPSGDTGFMNLQDILEETQRLVINREALNIK